MILVVCGGGRSVEILRERREEMRKGGRRVDERRRMVESLLFRYLCFLV
jgi:hypothetical protein